MRKGEARRIHQSLARHQELMRALIAEGMSREDASGDALTQMTQKPSK
jgi:hypothetical protein